MLQRDAFQKLQNLLAVTDCTTEHDKELSVLLSKCYLKLGNWQLALRDEVDEKATPQVLKSFKRATELSPDGYKAWHAWAVMNFNVVSHYRKIQQKGGGSSASKQLATHLVDAIHGFFRSISLAGDQGLQDILRLLTLWFTHGSSQDVERALEEGFASISISTWLIVVPQIIARIDTTKLSVRRLIHALLLKIGEAHPQALIYPLTVASKSLSVRQCW